MKLTKQELKWCHQAPQILRELAECHECEYTAAQAMHEDAGKGNALRRDELMAKAKEIEDSW